MIYFRSVLAGLAATVIAEILVIIAAMAMLVIMAKQPSNSDFVFVGWDPVFFARTAPGLIILLLAFVAGFWWEYRRAAAGQIP